MDNSLKNLLENISKISGISLGEAGSTEFNEHVIQMFDEILPFIEDTPRILDIFKQYATTNGLTEIIDKIERN